MLPLLVAILNIRIGFVDFGLFAVNIQTPPSSCPFMMAAVAMTGDDWNGSSATFYVVSDASWNSSIIFLVLPLWVNIIPILLDTPASNRTWDGRIVFSWLVYFV
jgi:hypothetical protein